VSASRVVLRVQGLCKYFGGVKAVHEAGFEVREGSITALIGPNGAGKTTAFNCFTGMYGATHGTVEFTDADGRKHGLAGQRPDRITRLGVARTFQNIRLFGDVPALDNVKLGMHPRTRKGVFAGLLAFPARGEERAVTRAAFRYLDFVGLSEKAHELAGDLPYGEQRRLEIARALALDPSLLLLDEPAAGMNPQETEDLMALIRRIRDLGVTVFLIEHDMRLVMGISEHIVVLDHGEVIADGTPDEIRSNPEVIRAYLGDEAI